MQLSAIANEVKFTDLSTDAELCKEVQQALVNESLIDLADGIYGPKTQNGLVRFKKNHGLTGGNAIGPTTAKFLQRAITAGRPYLVTGPQAAAVYGSQLYPAEVADLNSCLNKFGIKQVEDIREFLAQTAHESGGLRWLQELASGDDYEWREDLGNNQQGDGRRYKGGGAIQLTGRHNYQKFSDFMGDPRIMEGSAYVASVYPFSSAGFWWWSNKMSEFIYGGADIYGVTRRVNGGLNGINERIAYYRLAQQSIS